MSWTCPKCERELLNEHQQQHYCAKVSLDSLFDGAKRAELILVFDKILAEVADWDDVTDQHQPQLYCVCAPTDVFCYPPDAKGARP